MSEAVKALFGSLYLGPEAWEGFAGRFRVAPTQDAPSPHWSADFLARHSKTHLLLYAPCQHADGAPITLNSLRSCFGVDPAVSEPCFYNQDWYLKEDFAARQPLAPGWHLLQVCAMEEARARTPQDIESALPPNATFSLAVNYAFAFFAFWLRTGGKRLWEHDFIWCADRDHNGDRIYVGRYEDPAGINKNGFNIHRHLALRAFYSAAPEVS
jgi:hypothetical protein